MESRPGGGKFRQIAARGSASFSPRRGDGGSGAERRAERSGGVRCRPPRSAAAVSARGEPGRAAGEGVPPPGGGAAVGGAAAGMCPGRPAEGTGLRQSAGINLEQLFHLKILKIDPPVPWCRRVSHFQTKRVRLTLPLRDTIILKPRVKGRRLFPSAKQTELTRSRCERRQKPQAAGCLLKAARCSPVPSSPRPAVMPPAFPCKAPRASLPAHSRVDKPYCFVPSAVRPVLCHLCGTSATAVGHASSDRRFS